MNDEVIPVFEDTEHKRIEEKAAQIVREELQKQREKTDKITQDELNKQREKEQSDNLSDKVNRIRERMEQQNKKVDQPAVAKHVDKHIPSINELCPTCHQHELAIDGNTASCQGKDCDSSFLLVEKSIDKAPDRKDFLCSDCGFALSKDEAIKLRDTNKACPLCGKEQTVLVDIDWDNINKNLKKFNKDRK